MSGDPWPYNQMPGPGWWPAQPCPTCGTCPTCGRQAQARPYWQPIHIGPTTANPMPSPPYYTTCGSGG